MAVLTSRLRLALPLLAGTALASLGASPAFAQSCTAPNASVCAGAIGPGTTNVTATPITSPLSVQIGVNGGAAANFSGALVVSGRGAIDVTFGTPTTGNTFTGTTGISVQNGNASTGNISVTGMNAAMTIAGGGTGIAIGAQTSGTTTISTLASGTISTAGNGISYGNSAANAGNATITVGGAISATGLSAYGVYLDAQLSSATNTVNLNANASGAYFTSLQFPIGTATAILNIGSGATLARNAASILPVVFVETHAASTASNAGTVTAVASQAAFSFSRVTNATLNNNAGGTINSDAAGFAFSSSSSTTLTVNNNAGATINGGGNAGTGTTLTINNAGTWSPNRAGAYTGATTFNNLAGGVFNSGAFAMTVATITNAGTLNIAAGGTLGATGSFSQSAGSTVVNGALNAPVTLTGGTLGGAGTITGATTINGGTLSPGNSVGTLTVNGALTFGAGGTFRVEVDGPNADRVNVAGTATLAGTMQVVGLGGSYTFNSPYTVLSATSVTGTFGTVTPSGFGAAVVPSVSYTGNSVLLTLAPGSLTQTVTTGTSSAPAASQSTASTTTSTSAPAASAQPQPVQTTVSPPPGVTANQLSLAAAIDLAVRAGGNASPFFNVYAQATPQQVAQALGQLTGEAHAGGVSIANEVSSGFLQMTLDPNAAGRSSGPAASFASAGPEIGEASYASSAGRGDLPSRKGPSLAAYPMPERNYGVWAAVSGGKARIDGDRIVGSRGSDSSFGILAVGVDVRVLPNTIVGLAIGGGEVRSTLRDGLSGSKADVFQAALYGMTRFGSLSLGATLGYASLDTETTRSIPVLGQTVSAKYRAEVWSGRAEAGYDVLRGAGWTLTPFVAGQIQSVRMPGFAEQDFFGRPAGITASGRDSITTRAELGAKAQVEFDLGGMRSTAFVRAAWAHYFQRDNVMSAALTALPGATFTVRGAQPDRNAALLSTGLDIKLTQSISVGARFDSEFSANVRNYAGTANLRWSF